MLRDCELVAAAKAVLARGLKDGGVEANAAALREFLTLDLAAEDREFAGVAFFGQSGQCLKIEPRLFAGATTRTLLCPRVVIGKAVELVATSVIVWHNHPRGTAQPSPEDREHHVVFRTALRLFDVKVIDELVIGSDGIFSFRDEGLLDEGLQHEPATPATPSHAESRLNPWIFSESEAMASLVRALLASQGEAINFGACSPKRLEAIRTLAWRAGGDLELCHEELARAPDAVSPGRARAMDAIGSLRRGLLELGWQAEQARRLRDGAI